MFFSHTAWMRRWVLSMGCGLAMLALSCHGADTSAAVRGQAPDVQKVLRNWVIVQPAFSPGFQFDTAAAFAAQLSRMWGRTVSVDAATRGKGEEAFRWSLDVAPQQPNVLVVPEEAVLMGEIRKAYAAHVSHYEPVLVLGFKRWCVFVGSHSPLSTAQQLRSWVASLHRPVRIALPVSAGRVQLWVQGMEHSTRHVWDVQTYGLNGDFAAALEQGADLALARCDRLGGQNAPLRALVQSGSTRAMDQADIPTFEEAGWLPFEHGWSAFMVPKSIPVNERAEIVSALHQIARGSSQIRQGLQTAGFVAADLSPTASRAYLERFVSGWELVEEFLVGEHGRGVRTEK